MADNATHHHICLPSNCSNLLYENKANNYRVQLAKELKLEGNWEVALTQIIYPHNWHNINKATTATFFIVTEEETVTTTDIELDEKILYYLTNYSEILKDKKFKIVKVHLIKAYFPTPAKLGQYIKRQYRRACRDKNLKKQDLLYDFDDISQRSSFRIKHGGAVYFDNQDIYYCLGLVSRFEVFGANVLVSPFETPYNIKPLLLYQTPALYVQCNLVEYQLVGDSQVQLLRVVSASGAHGDIVEREFAKLYYIPINKGYINTIEMQITDDTGEKIAFESGKLVCMLHFRKCGVTI